jgi:hypothetical protein
MDRQSPALCPPVGAAVRQRMRRPVIRGIQPVLKRMLHRLLMLVGVLSALYALVYVAQLPFRAAEPPGAYA